MTTSREHSHVLRWARGALAVVLLAGAATHLYAGASLFGEAVSAASFRDLMSLRLAWSVVGNVAAALILLLVPPAMVRGIATLAWCSGIVMFRVRADVSLATDCDCLGALGSIPGLVPMVFLAMVASGLWDVLAPGEFARRSIAVATALACACVCGGVLAAAATAAGGPLRVTTAGVELDRPGRTVGTVIITNTSGLAVRDVTLWPSCECVELFVRQIDAIPPFGATRVPFVIEEDGTDVVPEVVVLGSTDAGRLRRSTLLPRAR